MRNPFRRSRPTDLNLPESTDVNDLLRKLQAQRDQEIESESRIREGFANTALWLADRLRPLVRAVLFVAVWLWLVVRFIMAPLRIRRPRPVTQPAATPPIDTDWQPGESMFGTAHGQPATSGKDELSQAAVRALEAWFGPAPEGEAVVMHEGVIHARGPGYCFELRRRDHFRPVAQGGWSLEDLDPDQRPGVVRLKAWRVVRLHDPITDTYQGLWLLRGQPGPAGQGMPSRAAGVAVRQLRFLHVTGSVFGRLGHMTDADKVDHDDETEVLRGDPDMNQREMESALRRNRGSRFSDGLLRELRERAARDTAMKRDTPFSREMTDEQIQAEGLDEEKPARDVLMRKNLADVELLQRWMDVLSDQTPVQDRRQEEA